MADRVLPSRLWQIDRDMGELLWSEERDSALDDVERAIRLGVLVPVTNLVDRDTIDYEAAYDRFDAILARPEPVTADTIMANLNSIIDAALPDQDAGA